MSPTSLSYDLVYGFITNWAPSDGHQVVDIIPQGSELLVSNGESIKLDQPLTSNPNVGGFG